jgi:hypothetical protein
VAQQVDPVALNMAQRSALMQFGDKTWAESPVIPITAGGGLQTVPQQALRAIGATTRIMVVGTVQISNLSAAAVSAVNLANLLTNVNLQDPAQNVRINCSMRDLTHIATIKRATPYGASFTTDTPFGYTAATGSNKMPPTIAAGATSAANAIQFVFEIPCAKNMSSYAFQRGQVDLSGLMITQFINAFPQLQLTWNPTPIAPTGADALNAVYQGGALSGAAAGVITGGSFRVLQEYYTLPAGQNNLGFPALDARTIYKIEALPSPQAPVVGVDCVQLVPNFRKIYNALVVTDQGTLAPGALDLAAIRVFPNANYKLREMDPLFLDAYTRDNIEVGMPLGTYWLDFRDKPLYTSQTGQASIIVTPNVVGPNGQIYMVYESLMGTADVSLAGTV